ncbi:MAG: hypothetical protein R3D44_10175 [Hyphomicrobiaceae bacterium]
MAAARIHVTGASGAGVTTLGRAIGGALAIPHHDTDDYFWQPTEPPFQKRRPVADRIRLMHEMFVPRATWVLSGSLGAWGTDLEACFDLVVYVSTPTEVRLRRLRAREAIRYGAEGLKPGAPHHEASETFLAWAASYDDPSFSGRSRAHHEGWLARLRCRIARVDGTEPTEELVVQVLRQLHG